MFSRSYHLSPTDPPGPPRNVQVNDVTKTSCQLTWEVPENDGGSPIIGYIIEKTTGYSSRWSKVNKEPIENLEYAFSDLIESSEYEFRICAVNAAGVGPPSPGTGVIVAKDPFDVPGKPGTPQVTDLKPEAATITWQPPESDGGAPIENYIIEKRRVGDVKWDKVNPDQKVPNTTFTVPGLLEGVDYEFRVTAENKAGPGPPSDPSKPGKYGE